LAGNRIGIGGAATDDGENGQQSDCHDGHGDDDLEERQAGPREKSDPAATIHRFGTLYSPL
jgi:hypothetical protein